MSKREDDDPDEEGRKFTSPPSYLASNIPTAPLVASAKACVTKG